MIRVVELLRVSTETQAAENRAGLPAQHSTNLRTCAAFGLEIVEAVEIVESGAEVARSPEMARALDAITSRRAQGILLAEYSRLFRPDRWSDLIVLQTLADHNAPIYLPSGPIDLQSELGFVQATINNLLAAMERRRIRERMDRGKEEHRRRGAHVAGGVGIPYGLEYTKEGGWRWTKDAALVRELFRRFLAGERNYDALARTAGFARSTTKFLLMNEVYTGWRVYDERRDLSAGGKYATGRDRRTVLRRPEEVIRVRLPLEPLVSQEEFALVQELIRAKAGTRVRRSLTEEFLYRGFLTCGGCDLPVYTKTTAATGKPQKYFYQCKSRNPRRRPDGAAECDTGYMVREKLERELDTAISRRLTDPDVLVKAIGAYLRSVDAKWRTTQPDLAGLQDRLAHLEQKRGRILEAFYDGLSSKAERDARLSVVDEEIATAQRVLGAAPVAAPSSLTEQAIETMVAMFARWAHVDRTGRRSILEALSPTFYVRKYGVDGVRFPLAPLARGGNTDSHSPTADLVTTSNPLTRTPGGLYVPLSA